MSVNDIYQTEFLGFKVAEETVLLNVNFVQEVIEPAQVSPLPFVPDYVAGLVNVADKIVPQIDLKKYFQLPDASHDIETLIVIDVSGDSFALSVNEILSSVFFDEEDVQELMTDDETGLQSVHCTSGEILRLFNPAPLLELISTPAEVSAVDDEAQSGFLGQFKSTEIEESSEEEFLFVAAGANRYAFLLSQVLEVVDIESITPVAKSPDCVAGIGLVRELPYLLLFLDSLLDANNAETVKYSQASVVIVEHKGKRFGLVVNEIKGMAKIANDDIRCDEKGHFKSLTLNDQLIEVVRFNKLFSKAVLQDLSFCMPNAIAYEQEHVPETDILYFADKKQHFGFCLDSIKRIVYGKKIEPLVEPVSYLLGTMEFDGQVVPVIDLLGFLNLKKKKAHHKEYIVVRIDDKYWAFAIHKSRSIISIAENSIDWLSTKDTHIRGFCTYESQLMTLINPESICNRITSDIQQSKQPGV